MTEIEVDDDNVSDLTELIRVSTASKRGSVIDDICKRLKIVTIDVDKVLRAKELLSSLQRRKAFIDLIGLDEDSSIYKNPEDLQRLKSLHSLRRMSFPPDTEDEELNEEMSEDICQMPFDEERWGNFFSGFQILRTPECLDANENSKCIELSTGNFDDDLHTYLLSGVRCFMIDLFCGPLRENQDVIVRLREAEICVSKQLSFPVVSTIIAKMSPRHQYTGYLAQDENGPIPMLKGYKVFLTVDRNYSRSCTSRMIYVNSRFLLCDIRPYDIILIGEELQLMVRYVRQDHLNCCVCRKGELRSYMPVLLPARCSRFRVSYEEVEDISFARQVGINVLVSNIAGTERYLDDLERVAASLQSEHIRLYARVLLNDIHGCDGALNWIALRYDGLLVELTEPEIVPDIMRLCPNAECIMQLAYAAKKPILLDVDPINGQRLRVDPAHYYYTFFYPDKFVVKSQKSRSACYFSFLQSAIFEQILPVALAKMPQCDSSHTGADGLARAVVTTSLELDAKAIIVCGVTTRMVQKISHFRPKAPILFVSHMRSAEDNVSLYHNVTMLSFRSTYFISHQRNIFRKTVFALAYLSSLRIVKHGDKVILVYNYVSGTTFPEKYLIYTFHKKHFVQHISESLFSSAIPGTNSAQTAGVMHV
ncbi:uncharacterized protein LOC6557662 [Drosophila grimshawi]|uniref:GH16368 n=1 Tax=Drosophila grimshawi TaxID=7222 RepID=B4IYU5_DROGR|nr:uncharacterized protein LOC6557662 [Drosophila grimshawi]EDV96632.1 GH16368 [Drosophila grimshawi]